MDTTVVILAGGRSSRMRADKAMLPYNGGTLLSHAVQLYRPYFGQVAVSIGARPPYPIGDVLQIPDRYPSIGPLGGLHATLAALSPSAIFAAAVDMPHASPMLARYLMDRLAGYDLCIVQRENGLYEPLFAAYAASCLPAMERRVAAGEYALAGLVASARAHVIPETDLARYDLDRVFLNINTAPDYERMLRET